MATKKKAAPIATKEPALIDGEAPIVTEADVYLPEEPVVSGEFDAAPTEADGAVTVEQALAIFAERDDVSSVLTVGGRLNRDGTYSGKVLSLDGFYR